MRELGRRGGRGRSRAKPERVHQGLREYLKAEVPPERVWRALELAMEGQNESARVSASRVLMDALAEPHQERDHYAEHQAEMNAAAAKMDEFLPRALATVVVRLLTTGKAHPSDAGVVQRTIDLLELGVSRSDPRDPRGQGWAPFFERLREERSVEVEIEHRVAERMAHLKRERQELKAQRAESVRA